MTIIYNTCPDFEKKIFLEEFTIYFYFLGMQFLFCQLQKKKNSGKNLTRNGDIFAIIYH